MTVDAHPPAPDPPSKRRRHWFRYEQTGRWRWYGVYGFGWFELSVSAFTEKRLRRKFARQIRAHRRDQERRERTRVES